MDDSYVTLSENSRLKTRTVVLSEDNGEVVIRKFSTAGTLLDEIALDDKALINLSNWLGWTRYD